MSLSFTNITDRHGPTVYIIGNGGGMQDRNLQRLGEEIGQLCQQQTQVVYLDARRGDGLSVKQFYGLQYLPCLMIVMDDDTVPHQWEHTLPKASDVVYTLNQLHGGVHR